MRLHRLAITAFGPFAGSEVVDLDALASSGLFLIHGPTGAGKSSILDAICFALYAAVPGARAGGARASLRSDHAPEGAVPEVTVEFTAAGRRLRVCRSPEFSRPKKRGAGVTTVPAKVVLDELVGADWKNRGTRNDEVALVLRGILGMGLEQFIKVVLLPQGDFAAFLRANPEERRSVLEKLFDTQRFTDVEAWLAERRRQTSAAVGTARHALSTGYLRVDDVIARLDQGADLVAPDWPDLIDPEVEPVLDALLCAVDQRASAALAGVEVARSTVVQTESAFQQGRAVLRHQETAAQAQERLRTLDEQGAAYQDAVRSVDLAERATGVSGFVVAVQSADLTRAVALDRVGRLLPPVARLLPPGTLEHDAADHRAAGSVAATPVAAGSDTDATSVRSLIEQVAAQSDPLQQVLAHHRQAISLADESARHGQAVLAADERAEALSRRATEAAARRAVAERSADAGRAAQARIPALAARHHSLARIQSLLDDQERSSADLQVLQRQADEADRLLLDVRRRHLDLRERRLGGLAAELAAGLAPDDPCPVCGSCVHPTPSVTTDAVSLADIRSAEADQNRATEDLSLVRSKLSAERARRDARAVELATRHDRTRLDVIDSDALDSDGTSSDGTSSDGTSSDGTSSDGTRTMPISAAGVRAALLAGKAALAEARRAASALPEAQAELVTLALSAEQLRGLTEDAAAARASALALAASTLDQSLRAGAVVTRLLASHGEACPCEPAGQAGSIDVDDVISGHQRTLEDCRSLATGLDELVTQRANARDAALRLSTALRAHGFESMEQAQKATMSKAVVADLTALMRSTEQQRAQANGLLAQPEVIEALALPIPDLMALKLTHTHADGLLTDAGRQHTLSEQAQRELRALSLTVHQALAHLGPAQQEAQLVLQLADCLAGNSADNSLRMRLSSYVLAARLAEIATLANERLTTMSDGRYTLEYTDARAAKGARSGLGLLVRDAWTGRARETSSLSGGESFMASLALALGMGDAVRAEAGGFDLQTLFVDEGFGSLDEESLEQVMAVLDTLREGGRAVGIVSHVAELRTRIPHQLQVLKEQAGSRIRAENLNSPAA